MTSSIKPPGGSGAGPSAISGAADVGEAPGARGTDATNSTAADAASASQATGSAAWLERYEAGELSREAAIDGIVADSLQAHNLDALSAPQRAELEGVLREALASDPTLGALFGEV